MKNKVFGYVRVSTKEQNEGRQIKAIQDYCNNTKIEIEERDILVDKQSGKDFNREKYQMLKQMVRTGDIVIIKELDRLGRNKAEIKKEIEWFKTNDIVLRILDIPTTLMDLRQYDSGMAKAMMDMINNVLIEVLGTIAEEERNKIKKRQAEGIEVAKAKGKHLGRPKTEFPSEWEEYYIKWKSEEITATSMMEQLGLKRNTFYRLVKKYEDGK
ncbi:recombinase family protein [Clostridium culturomicium]|uniref:recombinase family protein n=1 Tax=Clostridium culturomicium TaxID=1499683 RepID=UPI00058D7329|nr:recombinase family protein [Clostridium culturomicium]